MKYAKYRIIELLTFFLKNKLVTGYSLNLTTLQEFSQGQHTRLYCIVHTLWTPWIAPQWQCSGSTLYTLMIELLILCVTDKPVNQSYNIITVFSRTQPILKTILYILCEPHGPQWQCSGHTLCTHLFFNITWQFTRWIIGRLGSATIGPDRVFCLT